MEDPLVESKKAEAAHASAVSDQATSDSLIAQFQEMLSLSERRMAQLTANAINDVFSSEPGKKRFIDKENIPLICARVGNIEKSQAKMEETVVAIHEKLDNKFVSKERFWPIEKIVYGAVGVVLLTFMGGLVFFAFNRP